MILLSQCGLPSAQTPVAGAGASGMADVEIPETLGEDGDRVGFPEEFAGVQCEAAGETQGASSSPTAGNRPHGKTFSEPRVRLDGEEPQAADADDTEKTFAPVPGQLSMPEQRSHLVLFPQIPIEVAARVAEADSAPGPESGRTRTTSVAAEIELRTGATSTTSTPAAGQAAGTAAFLARLVPNNEEAGTTEASTAAAPSNTSSSGASQTAARASLATGEPVTSGVPEGNGIPVKADGEPGSAKQASDAAPSGQRPPQGTTTATAERGSALATASHETAQAQRKITPTDSYRNVVTAAPSARATNSTDAPNAQQAAPRRVDVMREVAEISKPDAPPAPVKNLSIQVQMGERGSANVFLTDRGNAVHLSVRAADPVLANQLRADLQGLETRLHHAGFRSEIWAPAATDSAHSQGHTDTDSEQQHAWHQDESGDSQQGYGHDRRQQDWRYQLETIEEESQWM